VIDRRTVFEIHQLAHEGFSIRKIARTLRISRDSVKRYLINPNPPRTHFLRKSKLDPFKDQIDQFLVKDPSVSAAVLHQRLTAQGFNGEISILRDYLKKIRKLFKEKPVLRFESAAGEQFQVDWGHFGSLPYGTTHRKLYGFSLIEAHSRMLYVEFTHSQNQETLHRCLLNAFIFFNGTAQELVHDNMLTAVLEREGPLIRFNEAFLEFIRPFQILPKACHVRRPQEKGKIEKGGIHYIRHNFWPLRTFQDLEDLNAQAAHWRDHQANCRIHSTTGQRPVDRFKPEALRPLPHPLPDGRETTTAKVHSDFSVRFEANTYSVPPWAIGKQVTIKADPKTLTVYYKDKPIATHSRSWDRRQRIELPQHREAAQKYRLKDWLSQEVAALITLGEDAKVFLEQLAAAGQPIKKSVSKLLSLKDQYGSPAFLKAIQKALSLKAYGAHYIQNILYQDSSPQKNHTPVQLKREDLNRIRLEEPLLAEYDSWVLKKKGS
jgi:transposase